MSEYIELPDCPGATTVANHIASWGDDLFLGSPRQIYNPFKSLDEHYDYFIEMEDRAPYAYKNLDKSVKDFVQHGPEFVDKYIHIDPKYYESPGDLQEFFNGLNRDEVAMALFGRTMFTKKDRFYYELFQGGMLDIELRLNRFYRLVDNKMNYFTHKYNLYPYPKVAGT